MYVAGYTNITNIDVADNVMDAMRERHPHMTWEAMDARTMKYADESFDIVMEKGALDALKITDEQAAADVIADSVRVLKSGGKFISLSISGDLPLTLNRFPLDC